MPSLMKPTVAVDFGTSTILVGVRTGLDEHDPTIPIGKTTPWMPSLIGVNSHGKYVFGEEIDELDLPDGQVVRSIKTLLGKGKETYAFKLADGSVLTRPVDDMIQELFEEALNRARRNAPADLRPHLDRLQPIHLCCPANWTSEPRRRLGKIAERAGLKTSADEIVDEPIAAGVSWAMGHYAEEVKYPEGNTLVFDYGGGTLDVAVLRVEHPEGADGPELTVLAADAHSQAGDLLDEKIFQDLELRLKKASWSGEPSDAVIEQLTRRAARQLKHLLSENEADSVAVPGLEEQVHYTRTELEKAFQPQLEKAMEFVFHVIGASLAREPHASYGLIRRLGRKRAAVINHVLLAGGMSRIPLVSTKLNEALNSKSSPASDRRFTDPEKSVVSGLTFEDAVTGLNLHRPGFDFVADYLDQNGKKLSNEPQVLYLAFEPFYTADEPITQDFDLGKTTVLKPPKGATTAKITCRRVSGKLMPLSLEGPIELKLNPDKHDPTSRYFKLYLDGRLVIRGRQLLKFNIPRWPQMRSGLEVAVQIDPTRRRRSWHTGPDLPEKYG